MFYFHEVDSFSYPLRFIPVNGIGTTGSYCAEPATSCTGITQYHKGSCACSPAFAHIGTITTFANCMEFVTIYKITDMLIAFADRKFNPKPIWLLYLSGLLCIRYYGKFCHDINQTTASLNG